MVSRLLGGDFVDGKIVWWRHDRKPSSGFKLLHLCLREKCEAGRGGEVRGGERRVW